MERGASLIRSRRIYRGQVSVEYMLVIGFVTIITIPLIIVYMTFTQDSGTEIASAQLEQVAKKIVDAAESMYYLGEPSKTTLVVNIPDQVVSYNLSQNELVYRIQTGAGISEIVSNAAVNLSGSLPINRGSYKVTITAKSNYVEVLYS